MVRNTLLLDTCFLPKENIDGFDYQIFQCRKRTVFTSF